MRRYWLDSQFINSDNVVLSDDTFHHIVSVCRQDVGSRFEVINETGTAFLVEIQTIQKKSAIATILSKREMPRLQTPHLKIALAVSRYPVIDAIVEKAVELGVHTIQFVYSDNSFVRTDGNFAFGKMERWKKIAESACQQSGRFEPLNILEPVPLKNMSSFFNPKLGDFGLFAYEGASDKGIAEHLRDWQQPPKTNRPGEQGSVWIFVGSEGGFSVAEVEYMRSQGLPSVSLGDQVLRVETACLALTSILKYTLGQMG